ncbi:hypothetical protein R3P82_12685 [Dietzia maris]|uniref:Helix-turn-helix domain-containing protein n=1 Tax=Dietzia maris TaxID=37915 RepID=A0AAE4U2Y1_9ACTN|nr:hypothetical protein [Dietzia maris]MDV6299966.1 hypothetical protein [Dietzia maris]
MSGRWPFSADTPLDRARRVAASYREAARAAGADVDAVDRHFASLGEGWVSGVETVTAEDLLTAAEVEQALGIPASRVWQWKARGLLEPVSSGPSRYRVADVRNLEASMRRKRATRRA